MKSKVCHGEIGSQNEMDDEITLNISPGVLTVPVPHRFREINNIEKYVI